VIAVGRAEFDPFGKPDDAHNKGGALVKDGVGAYRLYAPTNCKQQRRLVPAAETDDRQTS
jgi:hypothetical protein